jgi:hypothetical protein
LRLKQRVISRFLDMQYPQIAAKIRVHIRIGRDKELGNNALYYFVYVEGEAKILS